MAVTRAQPKARIKVTAAGRTLAEWTRDLSPAQPFVECLNIPAPTAFRVDITDCNGADSSRINLNPNHAAKSPPAATEPPLPAEMASTDELYVTGLHLEQYRHATRSPAPYWQEALRRDPLDARCNNAMGLWHLRRGEFAAAEQHFRRAIERLTRRNSNPCDGEPFYNLGLCLRCQGRDAEAYDSFYKGTWNQAWAGAGYHALAELDCARKQWHTALDHIDCALRLDTDNLRARNIKTLILLQLGETEASRQLAAANARARPDGRVGAPP